MTVTQILVVSLTLLGCVAWGIGLFVTVKGMRRVRLLTDMEPELPATWPRVSVIIPACNEADHVEAAMQSHQQTAYPNIEFVLVDDRSTDGTSQIVDRLAVKDARVRALHIEELPEGWLGKVHAMHVGQQEATGEWLLFTDADVHIAPETLTRTIAFCEAEQQDFLTVIPRFLSTGNVLLDAAATLSIYGIFAGGQVWNVDDPKARQVAGFGAFLLVRRSVFDRTEGLSWLRLEVADDLGVGLLMKQAGAKCSLLNARDDVSLYFYNSLAEIRSSHEKAGFAIIGRYRLGRMIAFGLLSLFFDFLPFLGFLPIGVSWLPVLGMAGVILRIAVLGVFVCRIGRPMLSAILFPVGSLINNLLLIRSGFVGWRNGGIRWRGTFYPTDMLRQGQRVRFP